LGNFRSLGMSAGRIFCDGCYDVEPGFDGLRQTPVSLAFVSFPPKLFFSCDFCAPVLAYWFLVPPVLGAALWILPLFGCGTLGF